MGIGCHTRQGRPSSVLTDLHLSVGEQADDVLEFGVDGFVPDQLDRGQQGWGEGTDCDSGDRDVL